MGSQKQRHISLSSSRSRNRGYGSHEVLKPHQKEKEERAMMENTKELAKSQMEKACTALIRDNFFFAVLLLRLDQNL